MENGLARIKINPLEFSDLIVMADGKLMAEPIAVSVYTKVS